MSNRLPVLCLALLLGSVVAACSESGPTSSAAQGQGHAAASVVAGSYDDWCGEHALPESRCTRCDPSLAAAFKATGDWCDEHGLPETQCVTCDPSRAAVRPPKPAAH